MATKLYTYSFGATNTPETNAWLCEPGVRFDGVTITCGVLGGLDDRIDAAKAVVVASGCDIGYVIEPWNNKAHPADPRDVGATEVSNELAYLTTILDALVAKSVSPDFVLYDYEKWNADSSDLENNRAIGARYNLFRSLGKYYFPTPIIRHYAEYGWYDGVVQYHTKYVEEQDTDHVSGVLYYSVNPERSVQIFNKAREKAYADDKQLILTVSLGAGYQDGVGGFIWPWDYDVDYSAALGELCRGYDVVVFPSTLKTSLGTESVTEKHLLAFLAEYRQDITPPVVDLTNLYRFVLYRRESNLYMRIVNTKNYTVYNVLSEVCQSNTSWTNSVIDLEWNSTIGGYEVTVPVLANGKYDLLFYDNISPAAGDLVLHGQEYVYRLIS